MALTSLVGKVRLRPTIKFGFRNVDPVERDIDPQPALSVIEQTIVPKDYVLKKGFPTIPKIWVTSDAVISTTGESVGDPTYPWEAAFTGSYSRFLAIDTTFDDIGNRWNPFFSNGADYFFQWSGGTPYLEDIEYRIGKRLFQVTSIRLPEGTSLDSSFNSGFDDAASFTVAMAGVINTTESASLIRVGATAANAVEVDVSETLTVANQNGEALLTTTVHPAAMTPFYLVLANDPAYTELRVATGTSRVHSTKISSKEVTRSLSVFIGRTLDNQRTLDMNLFEVSIFPYAYNGSMTPNQILKAMADVYGSAG